MSLDEFAIDGKSNKDDQWMTLQEVATTLSVSTATVRNWMKAEKIRNSKKVDGTLIFDRKEILTIRKEIESGASHRLKSRRNKRAVEGNAVPGEYVNSVEYIRVTEEILQNLSKANVQIEPRIILFEIVLCLLLDKRVLQSTLSSKMDRIDQSLTEFAIQGLLNLGEFEAVLLELWNFKNLPQGYREVLRAIRQLEIRWVQGEDLLGLVYMSLSQLSTRKSKGSYYTPTKLVDALVQKSLKSFEENLFPKVIDPCCGSGNFLMKVFIALVERAQAAGIPRAEAEKKVIESSLLGYEIDPIAVSLAKINLLLLLEAPSLENEPDQPVLRQIPRSLNPQIYCKNTLEHYGTLYAPANPSDYDLVIGNPPWGYDFTNEELESYRKHFVTAKVSMESFALFIEYGLSILKEKGLLAYVLPEALINVKTHSSVRKLLLEKTHIVEIRLLGHQFSKVFTPTITLIARKISESNPSPVNTEVHQVLISLGDEIRDIPQKRFCENEMYVFNVKATNGEDEILEQMRKLPEALFLAGHADFALGIVTGNNKEFLLHHPVPGAEVVLKGNDIFKYNAYPSENYLIFEPEKFQQVAPVNLYRAPEKLLYRFINENLVFAYDNQHTLSLNSANLVIPRLSGYSMKYILAVLNSRAAQFFHTASFSSVKVLRKHIESIPIPPCTPSMQEEIVKRVEALMNTRVNTQRIKLYEQIDEQIMHLYLLTPQQQKIILTRFRVTKYASNEAENSRCEVETRG